MTTQKMTTIHTTWELFQYRFLPFGLTFSPGIFQKVIYDVIRHLPGVRSYLNDVILASNQGQHEKLLQRSQYVPK